MTHVNKYSVSKCTFAKMLEVLSVGCGCVPFDDTMYPNDTNVCFPHHLYACFYLPMQEATPVPVSQSKSVDIVLFFRRKTHNRINAEFSFQFTELKAESTECLPLCDTYDYDMSIAYANLDEKSVKNASRFVSNKLITTMEQEYRLENEVLKLTFAGFMAAIGDGLALVFGMTLITFIQAGYWIIAAIRLQRQNRVGPLQRSTATRGRTLVVKRMPVWKRIIPRIVYVRDTIVWAVLRR